MDNETLMQKLHELRNALELEKTLRSECNEEIERIIAENNEKTEASKKAHEHECQRLKEERQNLIDDMESENQALNKKLMELQTLIETNKSTKDSSTTEAGDTERLLTQLAEEKELHNLLKAKFNDSVLECEHKAFEIEEMKTVIGVLNKDLSETHEVLESNKVTLADVNTALKELQEQNILLTSQIDLMKLTPVDEVTRGNSIFKEVEDNRKKVVAAYNDLKKRYVVMKNTIALKDHEIKRLKIEISSLRNEKLQLDEDMKTRYVRFVGSLEKRIEELETLVSVLEKRKESPEIVTIVENDFSQLSWVQTIVHEARKEAKKVLTEFQQASSDSMSKAILLRKAEAEVHELKLNCRNQETLILELKSKISKLECESMQVHTLGNGKENKIPIKSNNSNKTVRFVDDKLEETTCERGD